MPKIILFCFLSFLALNNYAKESYTVGLEPLPPLILSKDQGLSVDFLKEIAKVADIDLKFVSAPYNRLQIMLKEGAIDVMGHTPFGGEAPEFYQYAEDVKWTLELGMDLYVTDKSKLADLSKLKVGTPRGNIDLASILTGIPAENFYDQGTIETLLKMLETGRIDAFWFPRATVVPVIKSMGFKAYYQTIPAEPILVAFSVNKMAKGQALKKTIENALSNVDSNKFFNDVIKYNDFPTLGEIN